MRLGVDLEAEDEPERVVEDLVVVGAFVAAAERLLVLRGEGV